MSHIRLTGVRKAFGSFLALKDLDLDIAQGEFVTLLGGSGSGKTTCLRIVAGFVKPDSGRVMFDGQDVTDTPPHRRDTAMMFQNYALFPHLTVEQNVAYGLTIRRKPHSEIRARTGEALALVHLQREAGRYPHQLSGGQKQRVALARSVVIRPKVLLLDEPLGALDLKLRQELQVEIKRIQEQLHITTLFVTHDQGEALGLSDRIVVLRDGAVTQVDTPDGLYRHPINRYVADFVGSMNFFDATVTSAAADGALYQIRLDQAEVAPLQVSGVQRRTFGVGERCLLGVRPEDFEIRTEVNGATSSAQNNGLPVRVTRATYAGNAWSINCTRENGAELQALIPASQHAPIAGTTLLLGWHPARCVLLSHESPHE